MNIKLRYTIYVECTDKYNEKFIFVNTDYRLKYFKRIHIPHGSYELTLEPHELVLGRVTYTVKNGIPVKRGMKFDNLVIYKRNHLTCKHCKSDYEGRKIPISIHKFIEMFNITV